MNLERWGGRRWLTSVGLILIATGLLIRGDIKDALWGEVVTWVYGIFATGNVGQRAVEAARAVKTAKHLGGDDPPK